MSELAGRRTSRWVWAALAFCACTRAPESKAEGDAPRVAGTGAAPSSAKPSAVAKDSGLPLERIKLPPGFRIAAYATGVGNARSMVLSPKHVLYVGTRDKGRVYAIPNADRDATGDRVVVVAEDLDSPNGVAVHQGALYVAENSRILRFDDIDNRFAAKPAPVVVSDRFPKDRHHGWKFIGIGPDQKLYVPIGAPCNVCDEEDPRYASITRMNLDGSGFEVFARGVRNTVGFDWHPSTRELWFTDNGRDRLGDDVPPDELDHAAQPGMHFGFPYCHGKDIQDPDFGAKRACGTTTPPELLLGPHVAALGMCFYTGKTFPAEYHHQIFIAEHGSWNRSKKIGYRVTLARSGGDGKMSYEVFASGWLKDDDAWGRPVDVLVMPDGALLVSDDKADAIYRIVYAG